MRKFEKGVECRVTSVHFMIKKLGGDNIMISIRYIYRGKNGQIPQMISPFLVPYSLCFEIFPNPAWLKIKGNCSEEGCLSLCSQNRSDITPLQVLFYLGDSTQLIRAKQCSTLKNNGFKKSNNIL